jgi:hypothetical protein
VFAVLVLLLIVINTVVTNPGGARGVEVGHRVPPFAVPLAAGRLSGDADIAKHSGEGARGKVAACAERGAQILNVCQLYERAPLVLALFINGGSCPAILEDLQALAPSFPSLRFAAVALRGDRGALRRLVRSHRLGIPVGIDSDGVLVGLYKVATCPQVNFIYRGGVVQSPALLSRPALPVLRGRLAQLARASRAREGGVQVR